MQTHEGTAELASTDFSEDKTGPANILQLFKRQYSFRRDSDQSC